MNPILSQHLKSRELTTLVENRTTYSAEYAELNVYETHTFAEQVSLVFNFPIIASMLSGKKVMHLDGFEAFDFYPGESVIMPTNNKMVIDFPLATEERPTQCLALGIDAFKLKEVVEKFNAHVAIENENNEWQLSESSSHLISNAIVDDLIKRITLTFTANNKSKDVLLDLMIQELVVRLLQTKAKALILNDSNPFVNDTRIGQAVQYVKDNLTSHAISVQSLADKAHMSVSHFHRQFKNTLGISPIDYINSEKIKFSKKLMKEDRKLTLAEVAYKAGFNNTSYFNRQFKKHELITPTQFVKGISLKAD